MSVNNARNLNKGDIPSVFNKFGISIASPDQIRSWSYGEVKKPETINYRTFKPERDGLFCAKIFGPIKDFECLCGKYRRMKYNGIVCEKCGVEVTFSKIRRERMGHIELVSPVAHIWFTKTLPSRLGLLLDMQLKNLEKVLYFENYIVLDPGVTPFYMKQLISDEELRSAQDEYGEDAFIASTGAEALKIILQGMDPDEELKVLREDLREQQSDIKKKKLIKRIKLIEAFVNSKMKFEHLIMDVIPVIPPELRPLVPLDGGRFATSDLNDLYRRVINRNNRLRRLVELHAPEVIVRNEKRMLQESVDALFDNGRRGRAITGNNKRPLKSLSDMLKGKQGRFRQNLLGKRVDYSGRSVIVVGPNLKLHQCGLPKKMALELFRPFVYARLERCGFASTLKSAKRMVEKERPEIWDVLEEVIREHPVLLNRAPTLHRLGIQAFEPLLVEGKAIQLHPLVCTAFNADFDGDQMAVHIPLSIESQLECRALMMSTNNILNPASGKPVIIPSKDIVLGIYYMTLMRDGLEGEGRIFCSHEEVEHALEKKIVKLHSKIKSRIRYVDENDKDYFKVVETTPGRILFWKLMPRHKNLPFDLVNRILTSTEIGQLIDLVNRYAKQKETVLFADKIMSVGFAKMTESGISFGKDDLLIPIEKDKLVNETKNLVTEFEQQYLDGLITQREKYNKVIDAWSLCTDKIAASMTEKMSNSADGKMNSVYMMMHSKARGSITQMRQLAGMRGLMASPSGDIIPTPIISNFKEGLNVLEYFISTHGTRKGLADTALKTASSGYLTRRLVDVSQDSIITEVDCKTENGMIVKALTEGANVVVSLYDRIFGRCSAIDIIRPESNEVIVKAGELINEDKAELIIKAGIDEVKIRSVLTCKTVAGLCSSCYGSDLARGTFVGVGEAVGVVAAQSIGEPGTQLTLRTFHIGGAAQKGSEKSSIEAQSDGTVKFKNLNVVKNSNGVNVVISRGSELIILDSKKKEKEIYPVNYGARILISDGDQVSLGTKLVEWDPYTIPLISEIEGVVKFVDMIEDQSIREGVDENTGISTCVVIDWKAQGKSISLKPTILITDGEGNLLKTAGGIDAKYQMSVDEIVVVENNGIVRPGDVIVKIPKETVKTRDITGGLPRVSELFEARQPKDAAIIAEFDGIIEFGKDYKSKRRITLTPKNDEGKAIEYLIPKGRQVVVYQGDVVNRGDILVSGNPVPNDILRIFGVEALASYLVNEIQQVYRLQGVPINDKHIEVIVRQMLQKYEIKKAGDSEFSIGERVDRSTYQEENQKLIEENKTPAFGIPVLQGITKASLHTKSFISAASFQETTRVLTDAAVFNKIDNLQGLKENVIVGRLIPAGTGSLVRKLKERFNETNDLNDNEDQENDLRVKI